MKKEEIVNSILKNLRDVNGKRFRRDDVQNIINHFFDLTKHGLRSGDKVVIRGFGTFVVRCNRSKQIKCVRTGEMMMTREKSHVSFVQSNDFNLDSLI